MSRFSSKWLYYIHVSVL